MVERTHTVRLIMPEGEEKAVSVPEHEFIWHAAFRAGLELPSMCLQGWCVSCAGRVLGEGEWDQSASRRYYDEDREAGFSLLCTARPLSDLTVETYQAAAMREHRLRLGLPVPRGIFD